MSPKAENRVNSPAEVYRRCRSMIRLEQEHFMVLALDVRLRLIKARTIGIGSLCACPVEPREVFRFAIRVGAHGVICAHNHPSGDPSPSVEDRELTRRLREVGLLVGIRLVDHVIVAKGGHFSFQGNGGIQ
ncbi:MAG: JAB domain-containing protein [Deltaproteobacteria bacterium]